MSKADKSTNLTHRHKSHLGFTQIMSIIINAASDQTIVVEGQPGIGKTSMAKAIAAQRNIPAVVVDCATMVDGGDITIPWMMNGVFKHVPNAVFCTSEFESQPIALCLDEIGKANRSVIAAITPIIRDRRVAGIPLHPDSIVYCTSNNVEDNVGDNIPGHIWNGVTAVQMRNPDVDEWVNDFALPNGVSGEIVAYVKQNPQVFQHYTENAKPADNPLIFDPRDPARRQYVSPRSLERLSWVLSHRANYADGPTLFAAVAGTVGLAAAHDLITLIHLNDTLPTYEDVIKDPLKIAPPQRGVGQIVNALNLINRANHNADAVQRSAVAQYVSRLEPEIQAMFTHISFSGSHAAKWMTGNAHMAAMASKVGGLM